MEQSGELRIFEEIYSFLLMVPNQFKLLCLRNFNRGKKDNRRRNFFNTFYEKGEMFRFIKYSL